MRIAVDRSDMVANITFALALSLSIISSFAADSKISVYVEPQGGFESYISAGICQRL